MLEIELNGAAHALPADTSLHDLVESLGLAGQKLALAVNRQVVPRERWRDTPLQARDRVDVVRAIGGG
ncbi:thiamine biosynthesis protein ThiS [Massilia sp. Root133]|jgi:sulfur carrier protein|uniref:Sulfur carrier protein ThiS n=1 Tax=Massilia cellulosiltytica TaxID=2683234 RepID=A0A7X3K5C9_9BURK|nr:MULTISPECIES: sulfur carrier protein ThiS [unclassified Massilia]KQY13536.1 thiamine biosynthesis protein ThiS [Massilia sp. Root133]KQZ47661.1 thiamine biosynthesis protein ThiS [Massilia sp. Root1485]MVW58578.1 sulfur carrier protein ThiS [Telluria cellulosilytica]SDD90011.1 sulfur carrier protein ThiS [Massilia sp. PDC64]